MFSWVWNLLGRPTEGRRRRPTVFRDLPVHRIDANPENARRQTNLTSFDALRDSIAEHGIIVPLIVRPDGERYTLIAGHRRLAAALELRMTHVPAIVRRVSANRGAALAVVENQFRLDLTKLEQLRAFESVAQRRPTDGRHELAGEMGMTEADLADAAYLSVLPEDVQQAVESGLITEEHAVRLADIDDEEARLELVELIRESALDADETRGLVDRMLRRRGRFITAPDARHFHSPACAFARTIPETLQKWVYSKKEGLKLGKIACMNCL